MEKEENIKKKRERKFWKTIVRGREAKAARAENESPGLEEQASAVKSESREKWYFRAWSSFKAGALRVLRPVGQWFARVWEALKKLWAPFGSRLRRYISPIFVVMLGLSFMLWYVLKLGHTYTTELPVNINIEGREVRATVVAEAVGYRLISYRYSGRKNVEVSWGDLEVTPSASNPQAVVISPFALQNIISLRNPDLKVISMGNVPEVEL